MKKLKIIATIEARMGSTRLPGKVLKRIGNFFLLDFLIKRVKKSKYLDDVVVATTINKKDDKIINLLKKINVNYYRGSESNVNLRLIKTGELYGADLIVQLTADNPFVDPKIIDHMIKFYLNNVNKYHYITNCGLGDYSKSHVPIGLNVQIFLLKHLKKNYKQCNKKDLKEHPSLYFYREGRKKYKLKNLPIPNKYKTNLKMRLTVDTLKDLKLTRLIFKKIGKNKDIHFGLEKIIEFFNKNNSYLDINRNVNQKKINLNI